MIVTVHTWTKSACVVLAWSILLIMAVAAGMMGPARPAQANTRIASSTEVTLTSTLSVAAALGTAARPAARYVVQPGDTLSGIAARLAVRGGWQAVYAANRPGHLSPVVSGFPERVYVPNSGGNSVDVIDPRTYRVIGHYPVGQYPQHITPSWDLRWLYVNNTDSNSLTVARP